MSGAKARLPELSKHVNMLIVKWQTSLYPYPYSSQKKGVKKQHAAPTHDAAPTGSDRLPTPRHVNTFSVFLIYFLDFFASSCGSGDT